MAKRNGDKHFVEKDLLARHGNTGYVSVKKVRVEREQERNTVFLAIERGWIDSMGDRHLRNFCTIPFSEKNVEGLIGLLEEVLV